MFIIYDINDTELIENNTSLIKINIWEIYSFRQEVLSNLSCYEKKIFNFINIS